VNDHDALLAAVIADPDEDTPRLMMADWFDENDQPERAEFVRVQVELARTPEPEYKTIRPVAPDHADYEWGRCGSCARLAHPCRFHELLRRERELLDGFNRDKVDCCPRAFPGFRLVGLDVGWYRGLNTLGEVRRGFVECVTCTAEDWLRAGDTVLAKNPVREVTFPTPPVGFDAPAVGPFDASSSYRVAGGPRDATLRFARRWPGVWFGTYDVGLYVVRYYRTPGGATRVWEHRDVTRERLLTAAT
jgi:uncharacterized protein (TIGR02996 family)